LLIIITFSNIPIITFTKLKFEFIISYSRVFTYFYLKPSELNEIFNFTKQKFFPDFLIVKIGGHLMFKLNTVTRSGQENRINGRGDPLR
jgi:hypothetical protein